MQATVLTRPSWWERNRVKVAPYLFIAPFFLFFLVFTAWPILESFRLSFYKGAGLGEKTFYGLGNYARLFGDPRYIKAVINTTYYAAGSIFILSPLALLVALAINSRYVRWKDFFKLALFLPTITSSVVIALMFSLVLDQRYGLLNAFLGNFGIPPIGWLTTREWVMPAFILMGIWNWIGINTLYWLAGLNGISRELYEAARVDGAGALASFRYITLPLLKPVTLFVIIQAINGSYHLFAQPFLLTGGGPADSSLTITLYLYNQGFSFLQFGYANAIGYSMVVIILVLSLLNLLLFGGFRTTGD